MARIKHIAIRTPDPEKTAAFYKEVFGLQEVGQAGRGYYLSDGYINLAILPARNGRPEGIEHFGFQVDDVREIARLGKDAGASTGIAPRPQDGRYAEFRIHDPEGNAVDISQFKGWEVDVDRWERTG